MGLVAPGHVESSQTRDQTHVPCIGRRILITYHQGSSRLFFSLLQFLWILLLEERFVQVQALHQRVPGPSPSQKDVGGRHLDLT